MKTYYLIFGYSDKWYTRFLRGYTHLSVVYKIPGGYVYLNPLLSSCKIEAAASFGIHEDMEVLQVKVNVLKANRLIKPIFQTCATFVQYVIGISTGAFLCQSLYNRLTTRIYRGVEVKKWVLKQLPPD